MNIKPLIKEAYQTMIDKGFFTCPECESNETLEGYPDPDCKTCHGSGINPDKNIGEQLMLIVSELGEALEAHRNNRFADFKLVSIDSILHDILSEYEKVKPIGVSMFECKVKDTFEDEIADVFLRLFTLCGYLVKPEELHWIIKRYEKYDRESCFDVENIGEWMFDFILYDLEKIRHDYKTGCNFIPSCGDVFAVLEEFCKYHKIDIEKHIAAKMAYNKTRPHKHGKEY